MGRIGQGFWKVLYRGFVEEFPDLVSLVSEVSSGPLWDASRIPRTFDAAVRFLCTAFPEFRILGEVEI